MVNLLESEEIIRVGLEKRLFGMVPIITNCGISHDLVQAFSEIIISYVDQMATDKKNFDELANMFNQMTISHPSLNNLVNDFDSMEISNN